MPRIWGEVPASHPALSAVCRPLKGMCLRPLFHHTGPPAALWWPLGRGVLLVRRTSPSLSPGWGPAIQTLRSRSFQTRRVPRPSWTESSPGPRPESPPPYAACAPGVDRGVLCCRGWHEEPFSEECGEGLHAQWALRLTLVPAWMGKLPSAIIPAPAPLQPSPGGTQQCYPASATPPDSQSLNPQPCHLAGRMALGACTQPWTSWSPPPGGSAPTCPHMS